MKKIIYISFLTILLISCSAKVELTQEYIENQYTETDRSINLIDKNLVGFISLNEFKTETEVNNIYLSNNKIEVLNISNYDKLGKLDISNNNIRFISDLNIPLNIRHLNISGNKLNSLSGLEKYKNLKTLNISNNILNEEDLKEILNLKKLIFIKAEGNNFSIEILNKINNVNHIFLLKNSDPFTN